jgi:adenylosuccinate lyase
MATKKLSPTSLKPEISNPNENHPLFLTSISPETGRWWGQLEEVSEYFSEYATYKNRVRVIVDWVIKLYDLGLILDSNKKSTKLKPEERKALSSIWQKFNEKDALQIWQNDLNMNHDTKAAELFVEDKIKKAKLSYSVNYISLGLTATDIDNVAFALSLQGFLSDVWAKAINNLLNSFLQLIKANTVAFLGRTHGVPAATTSIQKEFTNTATELKDLSLSLSKVVIEAKIGGDVGTRAALKSASEILSNKINWKIATDEFVRAYGLKPQTFVTQSESQSNKNLIFSYLSQFSRVGEKFVSDLWLYNSLGLSSWSDKLSRTGSTTMPHKINPIGTEKAETYFYLGRELLHSIEELTLRSRMQRALVDKYAIRHIGPALSFLYLAVQETTDAILRTKWNAEFMKNELNNHWEILSAVIVTILKSVGDIKDPYSYLKAQVRGKTWSKTDYLEVIKSLPLNDKLKAKLNHYTPEKYLGEAASLTKLGISEIEKYLREK